MLATSRSGVRLRLRLGERTQPVAFEIDDHHVFARIEHLIEVIVAVTAHAQAGELSRKQGS